VIKSSPFTIFLKPVIITLLLTRSSLNHPEGFCLPALAIWKAVKGKDKKDKPQGTGEKK